MFLLRHLIGRGGGYQRNPDDDGGQNFSNNRGGFPNRQDQGRNGNFERRGGSRGMKTHSSS